MKFNFVVTATEAIGFIEYLGGLVTRLFWVVMFLFAAVLYYGMQSGIIEREGVAWHLIRGLCIAAIPFTLFILIPIAILYTIIKYLILGK